MKKSSISKDAYTDAYKRLNPSQKEAVDTIEGPVMVIAGPGTGKTQILTLRIANILLKTDAKPENILALTFTESGAAAMRERLLRYIGTEAYQVRIFTFHGFAQQLIAQYPDAYSKIIGGRPASDIEKIERIQAILEDTSITHLRPMGDPSYYVKHIRSMISELKQEYITPDSFARIIQKQEVELLGIEKLHTKGAHIGKVRGEYQKKEKSIGKNRELLICYRAYEALLFTDRLYDFEDMIVETVRALEKDENMLRDLQEQYQYVLADEHQDVNGSQNRILELLTSFHDQPNIFVVGDEKQAIFRFQGASLENFLYFENSFTKTKTISLTSNYRSGQAILDAAHSLIEVADGPLKALRVPLYAEVVLHSQLTRQNFTHQAYEDSALVTKVGQLISSGVLPEEIVVIVRTNKEVEAFAALLRKENIAVSATADGDILKHPITFSVLSLINAITEASDESALFTVLHGAYWGIGADDLVRICGARNYATSLAYIISDAHKLTELGVKHIDAVLHVTAVLTKARALSLIEAPHRVLQYVLTESGLLNCIIVDDALEGGRVVRRLYDELESMSVQDDSFTLFDIKQAFAIKERYGLALNAPYISTHSNAVKVMTAHKSKGLEFSHVFIPHLTDTSWGGSVSRTYFDVPLTKHLSAQTVEEFDAQDDERRLLYVALTRAKCEVYLSHSDTNQEGRTFIPSRLLEEIDTAYIADVETTEIEAIFDPTSELVKLSKAPIVDVQILKTVLHERGISATALNNYLRSPFDYFYRNVLRIPEVQALPMQFGTVLHNVMEKVTKMYTKEKKIPSVTVIKEYLEHELNKMPFTKDEYVRMHEKGFSALVQYIEFIAPTLPKETKEEFKISVFLETGIPEFPELLLTGKLDRLNFDQNGNVSEVIDYKSGKPKTRNEIEGNTKSSNGDYKRQLTFYALLLSLYGDERYVCNKGTLTFVESDAKGKIHEESFEISDVEIEDLTQELIRVTKEIISGSFLRVPCDPATSSYCHLASLLDV